MDYGTGEVLYAKGAEKPMAPASMTKIMTVDMVFEALRTGAVTMDTEFHVSEEAWRRGGAKSGSSTMFLKLNSKARVEDLLRGAVIQSGNDACIALAEGLAGSEDGFAAQMTARAREMGLSSATFKNSTGWPHPEHQISAIDLAKLARHQIQSYPEHYPLYAERSFTWNGIKQGNRNPLLGKVTGADGMKTGSTEASGYGLVGTAERNGERRIIVINGLDSKSARASESVSMIEAAFSQFNIYDLYAKDEIVGNVDVYMGKALQVPVKLGEGVKLGLHVTQRSTAASKIEYKVPAAPITAGQEVGALVVTAAGKADARYPLYAAQDVKAKSAFAKAWTVLLKKIRG
jgi:D-alanyl-D-alanine carboxypeptidase (penicillin-binding protein 5/6)